MVCKLCKREIDDNSVFCKFCGKKQIVVQTEKRMKRPNGMGTVTKKKGNRSKPWMARLSIDHKQVVVGYYATKTEALKALETLGEHGVSSYYDYTVQQIYDMLCEQNRDKLSKSGLTNYTSGYRYLSHYADVKMRDIKTVHIQEAINRAANEGVGYATWKKIQNVASLMCRIAMANDLIDKNYAQLVTMPKAHEKADKSAFSREQLEELWELFEYRQEPGISSILFMCYTGLRVNEFLDVTKDQVDMDQMVVYAKGSKTEAGKDRIVPMPDRIRPVLESLMALPGQHLFSSPSGKRFDARNYRDRVFYKVLDKYNLNPQNDLTPHSCRHTFALLCVSAAVSQKATMDALGHTKYSTSADIYANATKKDVEFLRKEINKIR